MIDCDNSPPENDRNRDNVIKKELTEIKRILTYSEIKDKQELFSISERIDSFIMNLFI